MSNLTVTQRGHVQSGHLGARARRSAKIGICDSIELELTVTNGGGFSGVSDKAILAFLSFDAATRVAAHPPNIKLVAFDKLYNVSSGTSRQLKLSIAPDARGVLPDSSSTALAPPPSALQLLPGTITLHVGGGLPGGAESTAEVAIEVQGPAQPLAACS